jgi:hypothetical protein
VFGPIHVHRWLLAPVQDLQLPESGAIPADTQEGLPAAKNDGSWKDNFALYPRLLVRLAQLLMIELSAPAYGRADLV